MEEETPPLPLLPAGASVAAAAGRKRLPNRERPAAAEDDALSQIARQRSTALFGGSRFLSFSLGREAQLSSEEAAIESFFDLRAAFDLISLLHLWNKLNTKTTISDHILVLYILC